MKVKVKKKNVTEPESNPGSTSCNICIEFMTTIKFKISAPQFPLKDD